MNNEPIIDRRFLRIDRFPVASFCHLIPCVILDWKGNQQLIVNAFSAIAHLGTPPPLFFINNPSKIYRFFFESFPADPEIENIAVQVAIKHEEAQGRVVESVEKDNRGFDLISRKPHPEDPKTAIDVRFIEVKGRADTGEIALTSNEYNTAKRLKKDYWLYIVFHCATTPSLNTIRDPAQLDWQPSCQS